MPDTTTPVPAQRWSTLPTAAQELITKPLRRQAGDALAAARHHMRVAKTKQSASAHKKEADRAKRKMLEATALLAALRVLTGEGADIHAEESRIVKV